MGKKGGWFSAIKKVFAHSSKDNNRRDGSSSDKKIDSVKKKKGKGILRNGENRSFLPLFKEPSSIEKILGEADQLFIRPSSLENQTLLPPRKSASFSDSLPVNAIPSFSKVNNNNGVSPLRAASAPSKALPQKPIVNSPSIDARNNPKAVIEPFKAAPSSSKAPPQKPSEAHNNPKVVIEPSKASSSSSKAPPQKPVVASPSIDARNNLKSVVIEPSKAAPSSSKAPPQKPIEVRNNPKSVVERENQQKHRRPEPTLRHQQISATKIQAAFRGYLARRSFGALRGLVRLQGVVRGQSVRRQTANAMKQMQLLVRVQTQIQSRRIQMLENQANQRQNKEIEGTLSKWTNQLSEMDNENWDDSVLTKEEADARLRKKVEAVIKRERAMAYAYSHQGSRGIPNQASYQGIASNGLPRWWNWLERQLPRHKTNMKNDELFAFSNNRVRTPENQESSLLTPQSSMSMRGKQFSYHTPIRTPPPRAPRAYSSNKTILKDDDSLVSCPPFSAPSYMMPTASAKAKERANSNLKERFAIGTTMTPLNESKKKKRFSFPLTPNWNSNNSDNRRALEKRDSSRSIGDLSVDSTVSMPAIVGGRKPFNRFV